MLDAHAKLNLRLRVGPKDGRLHTILSVMAPLELADTLQFFPLESGFSVSCDDASILPEANVVSRAAQALRRPLPGVRIHVSKRIPQQAGLGGGSADAAAALRGLARIWGSRGEALAPEELQAAAQECGSDVPGCLAPGLKIVAGVGERVASFPGPAPDWGIVLLKPQAGMPTARAYELFDAALGQPPGALPNDGFPDVSEQRLAHAMCASVHDGAFAEFCDLLHNDFQEVVERAQPQIADARRRLTASGARATIVCGSGSCVAGFFETSTDAAAGQARLQTQPGDWTCVTRLFDDGR